MDAVERLRASVPASDAQVRCSSRRQLTPNAEVVAERVAAELASIIGEVKHGTQLLCDGLLVHSLGEDQLCKAAAAHLGRPCIASTE